METSSPDRGTQVPPVLRSVRRQAGAAGSETKRRTTSSQVHSKVVVLTVTEGQNELEAITDMYHQCCHTWRCQGQWHLQPPPPHQCLKNNMSDSHVISTRMQPGL